MDNFSSYADMMGGESYWQEPDFLLSNLVSLMANKLDSQLGITLLVKGVIMTGTLVGEREYLVLVNNLFKAIARDSMVGASKEDLKSMDEAFIFDEMTEDIYPDEYDEDEAEEAIEDFDITMIRHLHLKDPVIVFPHGILSLTESPLPIMRIRLTTIDGWLMGRMAIMDGEDSEDDEDERRPFFPPRDNGIRH
jgi:hypothetical protein